MFGRARSVVSYANVVATLALFVALGGTGYALVVNGAVVQDESLTGADVMNDSLTGEDIVESSLGLGAFPVRGYVISPQTRVEGTDELVQATATCPSGKRAVGGHVFANRSEPSPSGGQIVGLTSFLVRALGVTSDGNGYSALLHFSDPLPPGGFHAVLVRAVCVDAG